MNVNISCKEPAQYQRIETEDDPPELVNLRCKVIDIMSKTK